MNGEGATPLLLAAATGRSEVVNVLIDAGAVHGRRKRLCGHRKRCFSVPNCNAQHPLLPTTISGRRLIPLDVAARCGHVDVARELLQLGVRGCGGGSAGVDATFHSTGNSTGNCSPRVVRLLVNAGVNTKLSVHVIADTPGGAPFWATLLEYTTRILREKKVNGEDATEEQLHGLEGIRRLLMRVEALMELWYTGPAPIARAGTARAATQPRDLFAR